MHIKHYTHNVYFYGTIIIVLFYLPMSLSDGRAASFRNGWYSILALQNFSELSKESKTGSLTIEYWQRLHNTSQTYIDGTVISIAANTNDPRIPAADNTITIPINGDPFYVQLFGISHYVPVSSDTLDYTQWRHRAYVIDDLTKSISIYDNGLLLWKLDYDTYLQQTGLYYSNLSNYEVNLCIGNDQDSYFGGWDLTSQLIGAIDTVRFWNFAANLTDVKEMMGSGEMGMQDQRLIAGWTFEEYSRDGYWDVYYSMNLKPSLNLYSVPLDVLSNSFQSSLPYPDQFIGQVGMTPSGSIENEDSPRWLMLHNKMELNLSDFLAGLISLNKTDISLVTILAKGTFNSASKIYSVTLPWEEYTRELLNVTYTKQGNRKFGILELQKNTKPQSKDTIVLMTTGELRQISGIGWDTEFLYLEVSNPSVGTFFTNAPPLGTEIKTFPFLIANQSVFYKAKDYNYRESVSFRFFDGIEYSNNSTFNFIVKKMNQKPIARDFTFHGAEDRVIPFILNVTDDDSTTAAIQIVSLPTHGTLYIKLPDGSLQNVQLASDLKFVATPIADVNVSSSYSTLSCGNLTTPNGKVVWHCNNDKYSLLQRQEGAFINGDDYNYKDCFFFGRSSSCDSLSVDEYYTEYMQFDLVDPIYMNSINIYMCQGSNPIISIKGKDSTGTWHNLFEQQPTLPQTGLYLGSCPTCVLPVPIIGIRIEVDNCYAKGWKGFDGFDFLGYDKPPGGLYSIRSQFIYVPNENYFGGDEFSYVATDCFGEVFRNTEKMLVFFVLDSVNDLPVLHHASAITNNSQPYTRLDIPAFDIEDKDKLMVIAYQPEQGTLSDSPTNYYKDLLSSPSNEVYYWHGGQCGYVDTFNFSVIDKEGGVSNTSFYTIEVRCTICPSPLVLEYKQCVPCMKGLRYSKGACQVISSKSWIAGVVLGAVFVLALSIAIVVYCWLKHTRVVRALKGAPGCSGICVIVFTDIEESTRLWQEVSSMPQSLQLHNNCLRECLVEYGGYEVKTQGDSFMIAFDTPLQAAAFSINCQKRLLQIQWPESLLNNDISPQLYSPNGDPIFRGFRVRIGIHMGKVSREVYLSTGSVDYFGNTVNKAARIESKAKGGEILVSEEFYTALRTMSTVFGLKKLGPVSLKGFKDTSQVYGLESIVGREFTHNFTSDEEEDKSVQQCRQCKRKLRCGFCYRKGKRAQSDTASVLGSSGNLEECVESFRTERPKSDNRLRTTNELKTSNVIVVHALE